MAYRLQDWQTLENVNENNMKYNTYNLSKIISYYFPESPCICSGMGTVASGFGQVGTTNVFDITAGKLRFSNRAVGNTADALIFSESTAERLTITVTNSTTKYVCASAVITQWDTYTYDITNTLEYKAKTLTQVLDDNLLLPMFVITEVAGVYSISTDAYCVYNYNT